MRRRPFLLVTSLCIYSDGTTRFGGQLCFADRATNPDDVVVRFTDAIGAALHDVGYTTEQLVPWERQLVAYAWQHRKQPRLKLVGSP